MKSLRDRRDFLASMAAASAGYALMPVDISAIAAGNKQRTAPEQDGGKIIYHYEDPYDYGVMQGRDITEDKYVGKNIDYPTCFFSDQKRMRWALQHMSVLQRTLPIPRFGEVMEFQYRPLDLKGVKVTDAEGAEIGVQDWLALTETDAFIAVYLSNDNVPIVATEQYFHGMKPSSLHHLWSMSKSLSAGVVAIALDEGKLQRDQTIGRLVPELAASGLADATLDDLLNMASGAKMYEGNEWTFDGLVDFVMNRAFVAYDFLDSDKADPTVSNLGFTGFLRRIEKERVHGRAFDYKDVDSRTAVAAAEHAYHRPFNRLFSDRIWSKIGAEHDAYICCDQYGSAATPYGISATLRDCARWGLVHLDRSDRQVLPAEFVNGLVKPHKTFYSPDSRKLNPNSASEYRDQYWVYPSGCDGAFFAGGWMGQRIHIFPNLNVVIVQLASLWPDNYHELVPDGPAFHELAKYVAAAYRKPGI